MIVKADFLRDNLHKSRDLNPVFRSIDPQHPNPVAGRLVPRAEIYFNSAPTSEIAALLAANNLWNYLPQFCWCCFYYLTCVAELLSSRNSAGNKLSSLPIVEQR